MNQLIEQAFLAATTATNNGVQVIPALAGLQYRTGTDYKVNKPEDDTYIVECNDAENVVGPLWKATIRFRGAACLDRHPREHEHGGDHRHGAGRL